MKASAEPVRCWVEPNCPLTPRNLCILCGGLACDDHTDGREWKLEDGDTCIIGLLCLVCVPINMELRNAPVPLKDRDRSTPISVDECMRLQRVLESLKTD